MAAWCEAAKSGTSLAAAARLLRAYRAACHYADSADEGANAEDDSGLRIASGTAFNDLLARDLSPRLPSPRAVFFPLFVCVGGGKS